MSISVVPVKREKTSYIDFTGYRENLSDDDRHRLSQTHVLFVYPVLELNEFELVEQPVSQRILIALARELGITAEEAVEPMDAEIRQVAPARERSPDWIVVHPMVGTLHSLGPLLASYREQFPNAAIVLQNSDQHQHEKAIGGPRAAEIAQEVLSEHPMVDWILVGFAEHTMAELFLGRPTEAAINRDGFGSHRSSLFYFESLPEPSKTVSAGRANTVRIQRGRGCLSPCTFCTEGQINRVLADEKAWDGLGVDAFLMRVRKLEQEGHFFITITDSSFEDPGRRGLDEMRAFFGAVVDQGIRLSFKIHMRAESVLKLADDDLALMKRAGLDVIGMGVESVNADELALFRKIATRDQSLEAYNRIEETGDFCVILGYIMLAVTSTPTIIEEKVEFLRDIRRGWDFLILTNRLQVFWGTQMHRDLVAAGLAEDGRPLAGYAPYRFADPKIAKLDQRITEIKRRRPEFMEINNLMYDAINLESRMLNPVNAEILAAVGERYGVYRQRLHDRQDKLSNLYCDGMLAVNEDPDAPFLEDFDGKAALADLRGDIDFLMSPIHANGLSTDKLYLRTWMAVRDKLSVA